MNPARLMRLAPVLILALLLYLPLCAETGILVPREVFVADEAEFSFVTTAFEAAAVTGTVLSVPAADLPVSADLTVKSIRVTVTATGAQVSIRFVPWISGLLQLPSFTLSNVKVAPPPVRIGSLVDKTGRSVLESSRSPLLVPGTTYILYGLIAAFLAICGIVFAIAIRLRKHLVFLLGKNHAGRRTALANRQLRALERQIKKTGAGEWYRLFSSVLRTYFGYLCAAGPAGSSRFEAATAREIVCTLGESFGNGRGMPVDRVRDFLHHVDTVRFGGNPAGDAANRYDDIVEARALVAQLEAAAAQTVEVPDVQS